MIDHYFIVVHHNVTFLTLAKDNILLLKFNGNAIILALKWIGMLTLADQEHELMHYKNESFNSKRIG